MTQQSNSLLIHVGVDGGNDSSKIVSSLGDELQLPNVVVKLLDDPKKFMEGGEPEEQLDVLVESEALKDKRVRVGVGKLAVRDRQSAEMDPISNKALDDQALIVILTGLAFLAAKHNDSREINAHFHVGTGLPVDDVAANREFFKERLQRFHKVTFQNTSEWNGRVVNLYIDNVVVGVEGAAALANLLFDEDLDESYTEMLDFDEGNDEYFYGGADLGALSLDLPVIRVKKLPNGQASAGLDNMATSGEPIGVAEYLEAIKSEVWQKLRYQFASRQELVKTLRLSNPEKNWKVMVRGKNLSFKEIADKHLKQLAERTFNRIKEQWDSAPLKVMYMLGGGSVLIRPYIEELNVERDDEGDVLMNPQTKKPEPEFNLVFVTKSEWRTALGYLDTVLPFDSDEESDE